MLIIISHSPDEGKTVMEMRITTNHALHSFLSDLPGGELMLSNRLQKTLEIFVSDWQKDVDTRRGL